MIRLDESEIKVVWKWLQVWEYEIRKGGHSKMTLDWLVYALGVAAVVFLYIKILVSEQGNIAREKLSNYHNL